MKCVFNALPISDDDFNHRDFEGTTISGLSGFSAQRFNGLTEEFGVVEGRLKHEGREGERRARKGCLVFRGFRLSSWFSCFRVSPFRSQPPSLEVTSDSAVSVGRLSIAASRLGEPWLGASLCYRVLHPVSGSTNNQEEP
jgi:hypothetical protein